jgi:hypothetical protein
MMTMTNTIQINELSDPTTLDMLNPFGRTG